MLERDIVTAIKRYLLTLGDAVFFWKEHGGPYGCSGIPDVICCYKGRFIGLECVSHEYPPLDFKDFVGLR